MGGTLYFIRDIPGSRDVNYTNYTPYRVTKAGLNTFIFTIEDLINE
jgi:hypothetical protein